MNRTVPLARVTPLRRSTPLRRRTGLAVVCRDGALVVPLRQPRPRDTGPSPAMRLGVLNRDYWCCVRCGRPAGPGGGPYSIQHRVARGVGGGNTYPNLIVLCGTATTGCHGAVEARKPRDLADGYRLESRQDPAAVPVLLRGHGTAVRVWLTADCRYSTQPPPEGGAA